MRIAYILMQFPAPSETFASLDVRTLKEFGHHVEVFTLRAPHPEFQKLMLERGLKGIPVHTSANSWRAFFTFEYYRSLRMVFSARSLREVLAIIYFSARAVMF